MKLIFKDDRRYVLRFDKNDEVIEGLIQFAEQEKITAAAFWGIGAAEEVVLACYDLDAKAYYDRRFDERLEIISLTGNIARMRKSGSDSERVVIHAHGSFSNKEMQLVAGHVKRLVVSATCEIVLMAMNGKLEREFSEEIGLNLLK